ncbi:MAG TPA: NADP-dependent malic enzyme [Candidatus Bathyarchaeia archaeon]|nr:NADP-dependent malic enzyme [Candidatus Bathyarchaeia archaeon]
MAGAMSPDPEQQLLARARKPEEQALRLHAFYRGKLQVLPKCAIRDLSDLAVWYSPGVAAPCRAIQADPELVYRHTNKGNCIAIVSDGTRVLGLGDIGPEAGLPVMEGKAMLFKYLGGIDAVPVCLATKDPDELIRTVELLQPAFGGINLEDIAQPKCFRVLDALRERMRIPVWHDDQQGSATGLLAGLLNALEVVGKDLGRVRIAMVGMGAANVAGYRLLTSHGVAPGAIVACDRQGILHRGRHDVETKQHLFPDKWRVCRESNGDGVVGGIAEALRGADVCAAFSASGPGIIKPEWVRGMARDAIVFACANPVPEIWPWEAKAAGARVVATGRGDFPNQLNNSLVFPGLFRGALDVRARTISDGMAEAVAHELARFARGRGINAEDILPRMDEWEVFPRVAAAAGLAAQREGIALVSTSAELLYAEAARTMREAREAVGLLMREGLIAKPPPT